MPIEIVNSTVEEWCKSYEGPPYHAALLDPPYHLTSIVKRFGGNGAAPAQYGKDGAFQRASKGFLGATWDGLGEDGVGVAFRPETWAALKAHLHPGAFLLAFASCRNYHRMACAVEDAGFVIHPAIGWVTASGWPKATRIKEGGEIWDTHRYGMQSLKPAFEFVLMAQVPYAGRPVECITRTGAGAVNIEGSRVGIERISSHNSHNRTGSHDGWKRPSTTTGATPDYRENDGRWPANLILSPEGAELLDAQSGITTSPTVVTQGRRSTSRVPFGSDNLRQVVGPGDSGGISRVFPQYDWSAEVAEQLHAADPLFYCPKAGKERDLGLETLPAIRVHRAGHGNDEQDAVTQRFITETRNPHPSIKPLKLCKFLATLLLPPALYAPRRLLCPFAGTASEAIGGMLAGFEHITAIEQDLRYAEAGRARVKFWSLNSGLFDSLTAEEEPAPDLQGSLFDE